MSKDLFEQAFIWSSGIGLVFLFIGVVWFVLCIILFFKIWFMTNDVAKIKEILTVQIDLDHPYVDQVDTNTADKPE